MLTSSTLPVSEDYKSALLLAGWWLSTTLTGLTLDVFGGQALALVGPNGGGKTTLMRGIVGGCQVLSGTVDVEHFSVIPTPILTRGTCPCAKAGETPVIATHDPPVTEIP